MAQTLSSSNRNRKQDTQGQGKAEEGKVDPPKPKAKQTNLSLTSPVLSSSSMSHQSCGFPSSLEIASCKKPHARSRIARPHLTATATTIPPPPLLPIGKQQPSRNEQRNYEQENRRKDSDDISTHQVNITI